MIDWGRAGEVGPGGPAGDGIHRSIVLVRAMSASITVHRPSLRCRFMRRIASRVAGGRIYLADRRDRNNDGVMDKTLVVDLLNIANPRGLGGFGPVFRFPFVTIEDVALIDGQTLAVLNDNNFPGSAGRTPGVADNNEFITVRLP